MTLPSIKPFKCIISFEAIYQAKKKRTDFHLWTNVHTKLSGRIEADRKEESKREKNRVTYSMCLIKGTQLERFVIHYI